MLKSARASYNSFDTEEFDYDNWSDSDMRPEMCAILKMTDEELPIKGSVVDWLQLIDKVQKERGARVLTRAQRNTMESFCIEANKQVEMYAFDIYKLLELVWSTKPANGQNAQKIQEAPSPPPQKLAASSSSNLLDSRQRSSKPLNHAPIKPKSSLKRIDHNEYDDGDGAASGSEGHPSISSASTNSITDNIKYEDRTNWRSRPSSLSRKRSQLSSLPPRPYPVVNRRLSFRDPIETVRFRSDEDEIEEEEIDKVRPSPSLSETNTRESVSQRRLREAERRLDIATKEYTDRIIQLETDLSKMKQEISAHKKTIAEHKVQEQYRLAQITELEKRIEEDNRKQNNQKHMCDDLKEQIAVKNDELSRLQSLLDESQESLKLAEIRFDQLQQELRSHERDRHRVAELQARLQEELRTTEDVRRQLEEQQAENEELKNIVDSIKFDLDEARIERAQEERTVMTLRAEIAAANEKRNEEFEAQLPPKLQEALKAIEMLEKVEEERDDYKNQALEALKEVDRARHKKKLLEEENERLRNDIQEFRALRQRQMKLLTMDEFTQTVAREAAETAVQCDMQATAECTKCVDQRAVSSFLKHNLEEQGKILDKLNKEIDNDELNAYALSDYMRLLLGKTWASFLYRIILLLVVLAVISNLFYIMDEFLKPEPISIGIEDVPLESLYPYYNLARRPKSRFMDGLLYWLEQKLYDPDEFIPLT